MDTLNNIPEDLQQPRRKKLNQLTGSLKFVLGSLMFLFIFWFIWLLLGLAGQNFTKGILGYVLIWLPVVVLFFAGWVNAHSRRKEIFASLGIALFIMFMFVISPEFFIDIVIRIVVSFL